MIFFSLPSLFAYAHRTVFLREKNNKKLLILFSVLSLLAIKQDDFLKEKTNKKSFVAGIIKNIYAQVT